MVGCSSLRVVRCWPEGLQVTVLAREATPGTPLGQGQCWPGGDPRAPLACGQCWPGGRPPGSPRWPAALRHGALALSLPGAWPGAISGDGRATGAAASLLRPGASTPARPSALVST